MTERKLFPSATTFPRPPWTAPSTISGQRGPARSFAAIAPETSPWNTGFPSNRPYGAIGRTGCCSAGPAPCSNIDAAAFQHSYGNSLLDKGPGKPWRSRSLRRTCACAGDSESAFADLDINKTYQYKAFGVPALGLKRGTEEQLVVAPYATFCLEPCARGERWRNLKRLAGLGFERVRYYEAMDFSRQQHREGKPCWVIKSATCSSPGDGFSHSPTSP